MGKKSVIYGAGNIGRGFIGQLMFESGYATTFVDVNEQLVKDLNQRGEYPLRILEGDAHRDLRIANVSAVDGRSPEDAARAVSKADIMAVAVGANALPYIMPSLALGISVRHAANGRPLNILICENLNNAASHMASLLEAALPAADHEWFRNNVGLVETSIGRMVPIQTPELQDGDPLRISVEAYAKLPADGKAFKGSVPDIAGLQPFSPFQFYVERKLFIHNMGHALAAYGGHYIGAKTICEAVADPILRGWIQTCMETSAKALANVYAAEEPPLIEHVADLLERFANKQLGDTVFRVGRDLKRKLAPGDRMMGALALWEKAGLDPEPLRLGVALALRFPDEGFALAAEDALTEICGLDKKNPAYGRIMQHYRDAGAGIGLAELIASA